MLDSRNTDSKADGDDTSFESKKTVVEAVNETASKVEGISLSESPTPLTSIPQQIEESWSYVHVHYKMVDSMERDSKTYKDAPKECFVHRTSVVVAKQVENKVKRVNVMRQTVSGLIFFKGSPAEIQRYLSAHYLGLYLTKDPATGYPAVIPDGQMRPFMEMVDYDPSLVRIMDHPIGYYSKGHRPVRILTGILKGHEGYIVRKAGDRKLFMPFGKKSIAISNIHSEQFVEI